MAVAAAPTESTTPSTGEPVRDAFRAAYAAAVETHSTPETPTDGDDDTPVTEPKTAPETPVEKPAVNPTETPQDATGLLTDAEVEALQTQHANDPQALRKALVGDYTKKTQALAAERSTYEKVKPYAPFVEAYTADPKGTLEQLAARNGYTLVAKGEAAPAAQDASLRSEILEALGPDHEWMADPLVPAITKAVERLTAPILERAAHEQTDTIMRQFTDQHPDWKEHEPAIRTLMGQIQPNGMSELGYLNHLYESVTSAVRLQKMTADFEARVEREVDGRFKKRVDKMNTAASEGLQTTVPESQVRKRPTGPVDFQQAAKDARAGIRYDDDD